MTFQPRFGKLPPLVSGVLTKVMYDRVELSPGTYGSAFGNFELDLDRFGYVEKCFALRGFFEWRIAAVAATVLRPGDIVFEGGAHIGTETFNYGTLVGNSGAVISYEADARHARRLQANLVRSGLAQCSVQNKALGAAAGVALFDVVPESAANSGVGALSPIGSEGVVADRVEVEVVTLDATMDAFGSPRLLVMDIQGGEWGALQGGARLLAEARPFVVLEVEAQCLEPLGASPRDIFDLLTSSGYTCWRFGRLGLTELAAAEPDEWADWIAIPQEFVSVVPRLKAAFVRGGLLPPQVGLSPLRALRRA